MRQFISGLPDELIDAARVDGARELRIFASIVMQLCGPAIATLGILTFWVPGTTSYGHSWWRKRRTSTRCRSHSPCTRSPRTPPSTGCCLPGAVVILVPILLIFLSLQRYFVHGIATTGIR
jgi:multiple sugar transport system permease protein